MKPEPTPKAVYLLAGGNYRARRTADPVFARLLGECRRAAPVVAYVGAASGDDRDFFDWLRRPLLASGAGEVELAPTVSRRVDLGRTKAVLEAADAIFISGGDVEAGMQVLHERHLVPLLRRRYEDGALFFGLSAGSIMLARAWVRWRNPHDDTAAETFPCLDFAPVLCDTHEEAEDWPELKTLLRIAPAHALGYGIPSSVTLCCHPDGQVEALGGPIPRFQKQRDEIRELDPLVPSASPAR